MLEKRCGAVRRWLRQDDTASSIAPPTAELADHVAGCASCRGMLAAVAAELLCAPGLGDARTCAACQEDIDGYIDCERRRGAAAAVQRYSHIWWHLWTCADCAEVYHFTTALLSAEDQQTLAPIPIAVPRQPARPAHWPALSLPRAFLHNVFAPQAALGAAWSGGDDEMLFAEEERDGYQIAVAVRQRTAAHWVIGVAVVPPVAGWAAISFGELRFRAPFDQHGQAMIAAIPLELLTDRAGPAMLVTIEADDTGA
jgi:hypothetical protein